MISSPQATILMSVYNSEKYLRASIESILNQTFKDFEFLIIDDGSTDNSLEIIKSYEDSRIRIIINKKNIGLPKSLNKGLKQSKGKYIARMDADDITVSKRIEKQIAFMDRNPRVSVCGTWVELLYNRGKSTCRFPTQHDDIFAGMLFECMLIHPSVMIRKNTIFQLNEFYNTGFFLGQDYEYWVRLGLVGVQFANIPEVLHIYRIHNAQRGNIYNNAQKAVNLKTREMLLNRLGVEMTLEDYFINKLLAFRSSPLRKYIHKIPPLLERIRRTNRQKRFYPECALNKAIAREWFQFCYASCSHGLWLWTYFHKNRFSNESNLTFKEKLKFFIRCLFKVNSRQDLLKKISFKKK